MLEAFGWRAIFWTLTGFGILWLGLIALILPEIRPRGPVQSLTPAALVTVFARVLGNDRAMG